MADILTKMTIKTLGGNPKLASKTDDEAPKKIFLCRVLGTATGIKVADRDGEAVFGLTGQFEGHTAKGEVFSSGVLYLPSGIQDLIQSPLENALNEDKSASVQFALDIYAISASNKAGYSFSAETLTAPETDPFAALRDKISKPLPGSTAAPQIEAPKTDEEKAPKGK